MKLTALLLMSIVSLGGCGDPLLEPDTIAPASVDLTAGALAPRVVRLVWIAPGDDGMEGRAAKFIVRFNTSPMDTANFRTSPVVQKPPPVPQDPGTTQTMDVDGLQPDRIYWFGVQAVDEVGNFSVVSIDTTRTHPLP